MANSTSGLGIPRDDRSPPRLVRFSSIRKAYRALFARAMKYADSRGEFGGYTARATKAAINAAVDSAATMRLLDMTCRRSRSDRPSAASKERISNPNPNARPTPPRAAAAPLSQADARRRSTRPSTSTHVTTLAGAEHCAAIALSSGSESVACSTPNPERMPTTAVRTTSSQRTSRPNVAILATVEGQNWPTGRSELWQRRSKRL